MSDASTSAATSQSRLLAYLRLFRAPNVFTAIADVAMGFLFVQGTLFPLANFLLLAFASSLLYTAGMVLNDVFDFEVDLHERPQRPLPSGRIARRTAMRLGYAMLMGGVLLGWSAGLVGRLTEPIWACGIVATALAVCVVAYDAWLKKSNLGALGMGACRFLNVLLGMSFGVREAFPWPQFTPVQLVVASGIGVYIVGVTWFARSEAEQSRRARLLLGVVVMSAGISLLAFFPALPQLAGQPEHFNLDPHFVWPMALFLMAVSILRRCLVAVNDPEPRNVQAAVKHCIMSLIVLDAAVSLLVTDWPWAVGVLTLLLPMLVVGKWVYST